MTSRTKTLLIAALLVLSGAYVAAWFAAAHWVRAEVDRFIARNAAKGTVIQSTAPAISGFPFRLEVRLANLSVAGRPLAADATLAAPLVVVRARPWRPATWHVSTPQGFSGHLKNAAGASIAIVTTGADGVCDRASQPAPGLDVDLGITGLSVRATGPNLPDRSTAADAAHLQLFVPDQPPADHTGVAVTLGLTADGVTLPPPGAGPLGDRIAHLGLNGALQGAVPSKPLPEALAAWRDAGGTVEIHQMAVDWGRLHATGNATVSLDAGLQLLAAGSAEIRGWDSVIDAFAASGSLKSNEALFIKIALNALAKKGPDGQAALTAPVNVRNGGFYLGPAKVAKVPPFDWQ